MTILSTHVIKTLLGKAPPLGIIISPLLDPDSQINNCAVDLRLGNEFIVTRKTSFAEIDPTHTKRIEEKIGLYQEKVRVAFHERFILHPNQLILGGTLEYVSLPTTIAAYVVGRSSWGRLGLIIATAIAVAPGFKGTITLELLNLGETPLVVYPGVRIAQLVLQHVEGEESYNGRYNFPTGPEFSRLHMDNEMSFWGKRDTD